MSEWSRGVDTLRLGTAPGTVFGRAGPDGGLHSLKPTTFRARSLKLYVTPLVSPVIRHGDAAHFWVPPAPAPWNCLIGAPLLAGDRHDSCTDLLSVARPTVGAAGVSGT